MSTTIHVVATNYKDQHGTTAWFWDRMEALEVFNRRVEEIGDRHTVTLYRMDADDAMNEAVHDAIANKSAEVMDTHEPEPDESKGEWSDLRSLNTVPNELYIEYTENGDYWGFTISKPLPRIWTVSSFGEEVGAVKLEDNMYPTFMSYDAQGILINTHVDFKAALIAVAAKSAELPVE